MIDGATRRLGALLELNREHAALRWAFLYFFCLLTGYYVLRPVRDAMVAGENTASTSPAAPIASRTGRST